VGLSESPPEDRCLAWLNLLGVYPRNPNKWKETRNEIKSSYELFVNEFQMKDWTSRRFPPNIQKEAFKLPNNYLMGVIHGDIIRTGRHLFFLPPMEPQSPAEMEILSPFVLHMRRLERILYVFANVNRTLSYMQGFNELLPPLYFVMLQAAPLFDNDVDEIEAVSFKCLHQLLTSTEVQEFYTTQDQSSIILHKLNDFQNLLVSHLPEVAEICKGLAIHPLLYCYRWFNLLFAQEHELPNLLMVWDSLFSHIENLINYAFYLGLAHIKAISEKLNPESFADSIDALQNLKIPNVLSVLREANRMWQADLARNKQKKK